MLECKVCGRSNPEHLFHCTAHYRCEDCGTTTGLVTRTTELTCGPCHKTRAAKQVAGFNGDTDFTAEITCPWCGHAQSDSWEAEDEGLHECANCENHYRHTRDVEITYKTAKIEAT